MSGYEGPVSLDASLIAHGSALILPLAVIEGPLVSVAAGLLSGQGYFDWLWSLCLLVCGDVLGDVLYYWIGRTGKTGLVKLLRRLGVRSTVDPETQRHLKDNATKMLLIGKWTQSIGVVVLIGSGMLHVPLPKFVLVNFLASLPKSAVLFGIGYFAAGHLALFEHHEILTATGLGLAGAGAILLVLRRGDAMRAGGAGR
jgi:membrane protein DedA with SNARE-associated domain